MNGLQPTVQDELVDAPASMVFYDDLPDGIVCARGYATTVACGAVLFDYMHVYSLIGLM